MRIAIVGSTALAQQVAEVAKAITGNSVSRIPDEPDRRYAAELANADWMFELSGRPTETKRSLLATLCASASPGALISTDESITPLAELTRDLHREDITLAVTHIFAPPARMRLAEISASPKGFAQAAHACTKGLGRQVLAVPDTPGFLANRMGFYFIATAMHEAQIQGISIVDADAAAAEITGGLGAFVMTQRSLHRSGG